jgi:hypothetical protein
MTVAIRVTIRKIHLRAPFFAALFNLLKLGLRDNPFSCARSEVRQPALAQTIVAFGTGQFRLDFESELVLDHNATAQCASPVTRHR